MPENETETALTSYKADYYLNYGYRAEKREKIFKFNSPDELIAGF